MRVGGPTGSEDEFPEPDTDEPPQPVSAATHNAAPAVQMVSLEVMTPTYVGNLQGGRLWKHTMGRGRPDALCLGPVDRGSGHRDQDPPGRTPRRGEPRASGAQPSGPGQRSLVQASGLQCFLAFLFSGFLVEAARQQLSASPQPRQQSTTLVQATRDCAVTVTEREAA